MADLNPEDIVLDLGCGFGMLVEQITNKVNTAYGVDIDISQIREELKEIKNLYFIESNILDLKLEENPTKIFCLSVLEHLSHDELERFIESMSKPYSRAAKLVVGLPTESLIYRMGREIFGFTGLHGHKTDFRLVESLLKKKFTLEALRNIPFGLPHPFSFYRVSVYSL